MCIPAELKNKKTLHKLWAMNLVLFNTVDMSFKVAVFRLANIEIIKKKDRENIILSVYKLRKKAKLYFF